MKNVIVLEIGDKKNNVLEQIEIATPNEFILANANSVESILTNRIFDEFADDVFTFVTEEIWDDYNEKIHSVYATFINDDDEFICSVVFDKFKPKRSKYRMKVIDWKANGYVMKYENEEENPSSEH